MRRERVGSVRSGRSVVRPYLTQLYPTCWMRSLLLAGQKVRCVRGDGCGGDDSVDGDGDGDGGDLDGGDGDYGHGEDGGDGMDFG